MLSISPNGLCQTPGVFKSVQTPASQVRQGNGSKRLLVWKTLPIASGG